MSLSEKTLRRGAAILPVASAFGALAPAAAAGPSDAPFYPLQEQEANIKLRIALGNIMEQKVSTIDAPRGSVGVLSLALRDKMATPRRDDAGQIVDKPQMVATLKTATESMLVGFGVVPPPSQTRNDVPVCFDKADGPGQPVRVIFKGFANVANPANGDVRVVADTTPFVMPAGTTDRPCQVWARQEGFKMMGQPARAEQAPAAATAKPSHK